MDIRGFTVHELWIERASKIDAEYYASIILDRSEKKLLAMLSRMGGMDVEEVAETDPDGAGQAPYRAGRGARPRAWARDRRSTPGSTRTSTDQVAELLVKLAEVALAEDATLIEVNPLIVTADREVVALDAKVTIDNNALFRHEELAELRDSSAEDPQERWPRRRASPT